VVNKPSQRFLGRVAAGPLARPVAGPLASSHGRRLRRSRPVAGWLATTTLSPYGELS
jgi:hypothetical protein